MEKSFGSWAREYRPIYGPYEAGLDRFVDLNKPEFVGREAAVAEKSQGGARKLITLEIDARDCDALPLAARELHAALADVRVVTLPALGVGQALDELVRLGALRRCDHLCVRGGRPAVDDVVAHRAVQQ